MKNRDKYIVYVCDYDLLMKLQAAFGSGLCHCVIEALTGKEIQCPDDKVCTLNTCSECIQKWLNKEA